MAIQIKDLAQAIRNVRVQYEGDACTLQYRAGANTAALAVEFQERLKDDEENGTELMVERLVELVASWDLMDGDKPAPITKKVIMGLPIPLLTAMLQAIADDQNPPNRRSKR